MCESYDFPIQPYSIQLELARQIYSGLQGGIRLMLVESPTGTGKTYSLLVPAMKWLSQNSTLEDKKVEKGKEEAKTGIPSWISNKKSKGKLQKVHQQRIQSQKQLINITQVEQAKAKQRKGISASKKDNIFEDYEEQSQEQENLKKGKSGYPLMMNIEDENTLPKIIFASRTHSQLSQVLNAIKLINLKLTEKDKECLNSIELASKEHTCINEQVLGQGGNVAERCEYVLSHGTCQYFHTLKIRDYFGKDIQSVMEMSKKHKICGYYSLRRLTEFASIVCVPYSSILSSGIRNRLSLSLKNSIIIFDQGHNVVEFQRGLHSPQLTYLSIEKIAQRTDEYLGKYGSKMKFKNVKIMEHFIQILRAFLTVITKQREEFLKKSSDNCNHVKIGILQLLLKMNLPQIRLHALKNYFMLSNIDKKLAFSGEDLGRVTTGQINAIITFLDQLLSVQKGRQSIVLILFQKNQRMSDSILKILCLKSNELQKIISESRLTIFAGGTMEPISDFNFLIQQFSPKAVSLKFNHIISADQCKIFVFTCFQKKKIQFTHSSINNEIELSKLMTAARIIVRKFRQKTQKGGGIVLFIQNYRLIQIIKEAFKNQDYFHQMFFDSKLQKQNTKIENNFNKKIDVFDKFKRAVQEKAKQSNPILVSVMGGRLSQGINFSDKLARCLIVLGLPFPNVQSPILKETIEFMQKQNSNQAKCYLQNLCFKTLNQTIGRAIRHRNDYADVVLVDSRFEFAQPKLSLWMRGRVKIIGDIQNMK